jgi:hypothetical protein
VAGGDLGEGARLAAATGAWICFEDEAGQTLRPPKARTWGRRGHTPVVKVSGKGSGRVSVADLACLKPGSPARFFYRLRLHRGPKGERRSMSEADYAELVTAAHRTLNAPGHPDLGQPQHPPQQGDADVHRRAPGLAHHRAAVRLRPRPQPRRGRLVQHEEQPGQPRHLHHRQLAAIIRNRLGRIQRQPALITALLGQTGLTLESQPP